jgi:hypothetical protein
MTDIVFPCCEHCQSHGEPHPAHLFSCGDDPDCPGARPAGEEAQSAYDRAQERHRLRTEHARLAGNARFAVTHDEAIANAMRRRHRHSVDTVETDSELLLTAWFAVIDSAITAMLA